MLTHVVEELAGDFVEDSSRQHVRIVLEVHVWHELHDVSCHVLAKGGRVESFFITIELVHCLEICVTNADDDDSHGLLGATHDLVDRLLQVTDDAVGDDEHDVELLVILADVSLLGHAVELIKDLREVGRPVQVDVLNGFLVVFNNFWDPVDPRIEDVAIEGEAVRCTVTVGWDCGAEPIQVDVLVRVVKLQDVADTVDRLHVLVLLQVGGVKRTWLPWVSIRESKVDRNGEIDLTSAKNVLQERALPLNL